MCFNHPKEKIILVTAKMSENKLCTEEKKSEPFTERGRYSDEICLKFDDNQEYFVPQTLLAMSSPVFDAMFQNDFEEKRSRSVHLKEKSSADFLQFLLCIHPGIVNEIDEQNVLGIVPIAEEYQVAPVIKNCKYFIRSWLAKKVNEAEDNPIKNQVIPAKHCLTILATVLSLNYDDLVDYAVECITKFKHRIYCETSGQDNTVPVFGNCTPMWVRNCEETIKDCREIFNKLPAEVRCKVLSKRLALYPN